MKKSLLLCALLAGAALPAAAAELSYTYIEAGYTDVHLDDAFLDDPSADGGYVRGSFQLSPQAYVFGSFSRVSEGLREGTARLDMDFEQAELGFGFRMATADNIDFTADIAVVRLADELEVRGAGAGLDGRYDSHENAGRVTAGLRGAPSPRTEAWVKAGYLEGSDVDGEFTGTLGGQVKFAPTWGVVGEAEFIADTTRFFLGVRASF